MEFLLWESFKTPVALGRFLLVDLLNWLLLSEDFVFEGEAFRAFQEISVGTVPVYRFFNTEKGGHFFTPSENERDAAFQISQFRFEGEAFYTFV